MSQAPSYLYGRAYQKGDLPSKYSICHPRHGEPVVQCPELIKHGKCNGQYCDMRRWHLESPRRGSAKGFPHQRFELARANKPSDSVPKQQVFMNRVWAPITMASSQESRDRALIRTIWMATATSFRALPKVTKSICSDSADAPTPYAH